MIWQDALMALAQAVFIIALIPALWTKTKPPIFTSIITGFGLMAIAISVGSLGLWWSAATSAVCVVMWFTLARQRFNQTKGVAH